MKTHIRSSPLPSLLFAFTRTKSTEIQFKTGKITYRHNICISFVWLTWGKMWMNSRLCHILSNIWICWLMNRFDNMIFGHCISWAWRKSWRTKYIEKYRSEWTNRRQNHFPFFLICQTFWMKFWKSPSSVERWRRWFFAFFSIQRKMKQPIGIDLMDCMKRFKGNLLCDINSWKKRRRRRRRKLIWILQLISLKLKRML